MPAALLGIGGLMLVRSKIVDLRPFRTGLALGVVGLMVALGDAHGGSVGSALGGGLAQVLGERGCPHRRGRARARRVPARHRRVRGCSAPALGQRRPPGRERGAPVDREHRVGRLGRARRVGRGGRLAGAAAPGAGRPGRRGRGVPGRRGVRAVLRRAAAAASARARGRPDRRADGRRRAGLRHVKGRRRVSPARPGALEGEPSDAWRFRRRQRSDGPGARRDARALRRRGDGGRHHRRAEGRPLRAPAGSGDEGLEGRGPQGRPVVRTGDDRDPDPRADPREAGRRGRGPEPRAAHGHTRRHLRRPSGGGEPALRLARQGHLGQRGLDRPRADAASPDRRHHRVGEVGLHQHAVDVRAAARDAGRRADDPHRPEADRAQLLRVDPAPPDARRLEPEGGLGGAPERRRRDGAPLRAPVDHPRAEPARGEQDVPGAWGGPAAVSPRRDRRARRPHDGLAPGGRGRDHPPRAEVARGRNPSRARDAAPVGGRDHGNDQGERPEPDRVRRLEPDRLARDPRRRRARRASSARATCSSSRSAHHGSSASRGRS